MHGKRARTRDERAISELEALSMLNRMLRARYRSYPEAVALMTSDRMKPYREHLDGCNQCGPRALCDDGERLLAKGKDEV